MRGSCAVRAPAAMIEGHRGREAAPHLERRPGKVERFRRWTRNCLRASPHGEERSGDPLPIPRGRHAVPRPEAASGRHFLSRGSGLSPTSRTLPESAGFTPSRSEATPALTDGRLGNHGRRQTHDSRRSARPSLASHPRFYYRCLTVARSHRDRQRLEVDPASSHMSAHTRLSQAEATTRVRV